MSVYPEIKVSVEISFQVVDISKGNYPTIIFIDKDPGIYEIVFAENPFIKVSLASAPWYIIKGTTFGLPIHEWKDIVKEWPTGI